MLSSHSSFSFSQPHWLVARHNFSISFHKEHGNFLPNVHTFYTLLQFLNGFFLGRRIIRWTKLGTLPFRTPMFILEFMKSHWQSLFVFLPHLQLFPIFFMQLWFARQLLQGRKVVLGHYSLNIILILSERAFKISSIVDHFYYFSTPS